MTQYLLVRPPRRYLGGYFDMSLLGQDGSLTAPFRALSAWARSAARRGQVTPPGGPIALPPRPSS